MRCRDRREAGMVLLTVLLVALVVMGVAVSFISFMNQQQSRAGLRYRSAIALSLAEAGVHRALAILEGSAPDGSTGRLWRPVDYSEDVSVGSMNGRFTLTINDDADGAVLVTSIGDISNARRGVQARVSLASPALLAGLYGRKLVRLDGPPATTVIVSYGTVADRLPWTHIAASEGVWFAGTAVAMNKPGVFVPVASGPTDSPFGADAPRLDPARLLLSTDGEILLDRDGVNTGVQPLRAMGMNLDQESRVAAFPEPPDVDRSIYRAMAAANTANGALNSAAGEMFGDSDLRLKRDSLYTAAQFEKLQRAAWYRIGLRGVIFVSGDVTLPPQGGLTITDGALIAEGSVRLGQRSSLAVSHSRSTRMLPGLMALGDGGLFVGPEAQFRVHGLVYLDWLVEMARGARVEVVGSILAADRTLSFWNMGASVVIRYDPAVLGTPGLSMPRLGPMIAWIASWEELP